MSVLFLFLGLPLLSTALPLEGCEESGGLGCELGELNEVVVNATSNATGNVELQERFIDNLIADAYPEKEKKEKHRTWRLNRKALVPILIGLALKGLALISLALTGLSIVGSIAIFFSKVSLTISTVMFLQRYFSKDYSSGGFFGLNPLGFPQPSLNDHNLKHQRMGGSIQRRNYEEVSKHIDKYENRLNIVR